MWVSTSDVNSLTTAKKGKVQARKVNKGISGGKSHITNEKPDWFTAFKDSVQESDK